MLQRALYCRGTDQPAMIFIIEGHHGESRLKKRTVISLIFNGVNKSDILYTINSCAGIEDESDGATIDVIINSLCTRLCKLLVVWILGDHRTPASDALGEYTSSVRGRY